MSFDNHSQTFMARWLGAIIVPAHPTKALPARLRIGSFASDGTVRLYADDGRKEVVYTCSLDQLRDCLQFGVFLPEGNGRDGQTVSQLARVLSKSLREGGTQ